MYRKLGWHSWPEPIFTPDLREADSKHTGTVLALAFWDFRREGKSEMEFLGFWSQCPRAPTGTP